VVLIDFLHEYGILRLVCHTGERRIAMSEAALMEKAVDCLTRLDDENVRIVISYMEAIDSSVQKQKKNLSDLKGKIQFADGYNYKAMRGT
jgi:hypothetical protein